MSYRPPTQPDIGKTVELLFQDDRWLEATLDNLQYRLNNVGDIVGVCCCTYFAGGTSNCSIDMVRVPYTSPNPIAELSEAADWLAERGCDEASRVLLERVALLQQGIWFEDRSEHYTDEEWAAIQEVFGELDAQLKKARK